MADLLAAWRASKERGEDAAMRRGYLDGMAKLLNEAYEAETTLLRLFLRGMSPQARQTLEEAEGWVPDRDWEQCKGSESLLLRVDRHAARREFPRRGVHVRPTP